VNGRFAVNSVLETEDGAKVRIEGVFGFGGQGEVYRVSVDGAPWALKWYYPEMATQQQRIILEGLVARGVRDPRFLWPQHLVRDPGDRTGGFGYLMAVRPDNFADLPALFRRDEIVRPITPRVLLIVASNTAEAFRHLHLQGIAYRDISWGNLFFDPRTGEVLVCDNDNAMVEGGQTGVLGTMDFMAPELVRREPGVDPTTRTDLHALAVLLFMLLMNHHPLEGAAAFRIPIMDDEAKLELNGRHPVFIFDPADPSNRPVPGEQDMVVASWQATPPVLRGLFEQAFTAGLRDPDLRVPESQWRDAFRDVHDSVVVCSNCHKENLVEPGPNPPEVACWRCSQTVGLPPRLEVASGTGRVRTVRSIRLSQGAKVCSFHLQPDPESYDFRDVVAEVVEHPNQNGALGLTNKTTGEWTVHREDTHEAKPVPPGRGAALREGLLIEFGAGAEAVFRPR
jgi:DNA-binding helix-hairpin-helix protein with protein kinase domain